MRAAGVELHRARRAARGDGLRRGRSSTCRGTARCCSDFRRRFASGRRRAASSSIDYPGFNMQVAAAAKRRGVPVLYYITPQVWAWGAGRLAEARADGHEGGGDPAVRGAAASRSTASTRRSSAIRCSIAPRTCRRAQRRGATLGTRAERPRARAVSGEPRAGDRAASRRFVATRAGAAATRSRARGRRQRRAARDDRSGALSVSASCSRRRSRVLRAADAALCKSGTTTLEAAVADCPLVVAYRTSAIRLRDRAAHGEDSAHRAGERRRGARGRAASSCRTRCTRRVADALEPLLDPRESATRRAMVDGLGRGS